MIQINDNLKPYNILGFTKDNNILLVEAEKNLYFYNIEDDVFKEVNITLDESDTIYYLYSFLIIVKSTQDNNMLQIYDVESTNLLDSISSNNSFDNIFDISHNGQYILLQQSDKYALWDIKENKLQEYIDNDSQLFKAKFSEDCSYCILLKDKYISILNFKNSSYHNILEDVDLMEAEALDIDIYRNNSVDYLVVAGYFKIDSNINNLLIFNLATNTIVNYSIISPTRRVPNVKNIVAITDKYIVLLAMYGFMDNNYILFYADIKTGEYVTHERAIMALSIYKTYNSDDKKLVLMLCNDNYNNDRSEICINRLT